MAREGSSGALFASVKRIMSARLCSEKWTRVCAPKGARKGLVVQYGMDHLTEIRKRVANEWLTLVTKKLEPKMLSAQYLALE